MLISKRGIIRMCICIILYIVIWNCFQGYFETKTKDKVQIIDESWNVEVNGDLYKDVILSRFKFPKIKKNDEIILKRVLPDTPYKQNTLKISTRYAAIKVYFDGELIYQDMQEEFAKGDVLGTGVHFIQLPDDFEGKELKVILNVGENEAFTSVAPVRIMDTMVVYEESIDSNFTQFFVSVLVIGIALVSVFLSLGTGLSDTRYRMILWLGFFSMSIGIWISSNDSLIQIMCNSLTVKCYYEYISMFMSAICLMIYITAFLNSKKSKKLFLSLLAGMVCLCMVLVVLNATQIAHFPKTGFIFHAYTLICTVIVIIMLAQKEVRHKKAERVFQVGIIVIVFNSVAEIVRYRYNKLCMPENTFDTSFIPIGVILFLIALFVSYYYRVIERVAEELERKTLYDMAYQDNLTGLKNRAWCEKVMREYEENKKPVTLINMDLNNFKQVNDTMGHTTGDDLLVLFASCLQKQFREKDCVGRMGGDEFIVIVDYVDDKVVEDHMAKLQNKIDQENKNSKFKISFSYGSVSDETGKVSPYKLYESADRKMYAYKKKIKKN